MGDVIVCGWHSSDDGACANVPEYDISLVVSRGQGPFERSGRGRHGGKEAKTAMFWAAALCAYLGPAGSGEHGGYRFRTVKCSKIPRRFGWDIHEIERKGIVPKSVLTRKRSLIARFAVLAMVFSLMAVALPASAHSVALDSTGPCPAATPSAGFTDIGGLDATTQTAINCLFAFGITTGTSATTYSPNDTITRWQMALFLIRQAADHGIAIPAATSQGYTDIGGFDTATQNAINQITQLGISKGTSSSTFSPNDGVTRWQMALFIYRTGLAAGVTFNNNTGHNEFVDIGTLSAEAQTAINALADTKADPEGHIALGTGLSAFSPNLVLVRWQMALFLTRLLAADGIAAPAGIRVTVTPTDAVTLANGNARAYTATFKNLDGTPYTGAVGITVKAFASSAIQYDDVPANGSILETVSDGLTVVGDTATGFPGTNGIVTFLVRHAGGATETVVPVAWEDLNGDGDPEITGNAAPTEPFGVGGQTTFSAPAPEAADGEVMNELVTSISPSTDSFVADDIPTAVLNTFNYDSGDIFLVSGVPSTMADFEAALTVGDTVGGVYAAAAGDQSTFDITDDIDPPVVVSVPSAATSTTASTFTISGTGIATYLVAIYTDVDDGTDIDSGVDFKVAEVTVAADGTWSATVNLTSGVANNFTANQRISGDPNGAVVNVPTITQGAAAGATFTSTTAANFASAGILDPGDTITVTFSEAVTGFGSNDTFSIQDPDLSTVTLTCGGNVSCAIDGTNTIVTITIVNVLVTSGGTAGISSSFTINSVGGFSTLSNGAAISLSGDRTATGF